MTGASRARARKTNRTATKDDRCPIELRDVWGTRRRGRRDHSTPTPAGCGASSSGGGAVGYVLNCRGVGYRLMDKAVELADEDQDRGAVPNAAGCLIELRAARRAA